MMEGSGLGVGHNSSSNSGGEIAGIACGAALAGFILGLGLCHCKQKRAAHSSEMKRSALPEAGKEGSKEEVELSSPSATTKDPTASHDHEVVPRLSTSLGCPTRPQEPDNRSWSFAYQDSRSSKISPAAVKPDSTANPASHHIPIFVDATPSPPPVTQTTQIPYGRSPRTPNRAFHSLNDGKDYNNRIDSDPFFHLSPMTSAPCTHERMPYTPSVYPTSNDNSNNNNNNQAPDSLPRWPAGNAGGGRCFGEPPSLPQPYSAATFDE